MIQCPECRQMIPDDSIFCDQCGKELKWCPECKRPKRGVECPVCGSDLVSAHEPAPAPSALVGNGWKLPLKEGPFGRIGGIWPELASCQYVSGNHGIMSMSSGTWTVTDNGSTNGTFINGLRIPAGGRSAIKKGDVVRIATLDFTVE